MGNQVYQYKEMTAGQLAALDRSKTLALMALSPLEVHGPHLPVGTSLMLAAAPERIVGDWRQLDRVTVNGDAPLARLLGTTARVAARLGRQAFARDLHHLGATLAWVSMQDMPNYMGAPAGATRESGEAMLEAHVAQAVDMLREVRAGGEPFYTPLLWSLRLLGRVG